MTTENIATVAEVQEATLNMRTITEEVKSTATTLVDQYGDTRKTMTGREKDASDQRDVIEVLASDQRDQLGESFENQVIYKRIADWSAIVGLSVPETDKLNSWWFVNPVNSEGGWYGPKQSQTFPITAPVNPAIDDGWALTDAATQIYALAVSLNTSIDNIGYATVGAEVKEYLRDELQQKTYGVPSGAIGGTVVSVVGNVLLVQGGGAYTLIKVETINGDVGPGTATATASTSVITDDSIGRLKLSMPDHSGHKVLTHNGRQYVTYVNDAMHVMVAENSVEGDAGQGSWVLRDTGGLITANDSHNAPAIGVDSDGYLHIIYDAHTGSFKYRRSTSPDSADGWGAETNVLDGVNENSFTYPSFIMHNDGTLQLIYRNGGASNGQLYLKEYNVTATTWSEVTALFDYSSKGSYSAYMGDTCVDSNGILHMGWTVWDNSLLTRRDVYYMASPDKGLTWHKADGTPIAVPVTDDNQADLVDDNPSIPLNNAAYPANVPAQVDHLGRPIVCYKDQRSNGDWHVFISYFNGTSWVKKQVTDDSEPQVPSVQTEIEAGVYGTQPIVFACGGSTYIITANRPYNTAPVLIESMNDDYTEFRRMLISEQQLYNCSPTVDYTALKDGVINMLVTGAYEETVRYSALMPANDMSLVTVDALGRGATPLSSDYIPKNHSLPTPITPIQTIAGRPTDADSDYTLTGSFGFISTIQAPRGNVSLSSIGEDVDLYAQFRIRQGSASPSGAFSLRFADGGSNWFSDSQQHNGAARTSITSKWFKIPRSLILADNEVVLFLQGKVDSGGTPTLNYVDTWVTLGVKNRLVK